MLDLDKINLRQLRMFNDLSQQRMGDILGISKQAYNMKEKKKQKFTEEQIKTISEIFKISDEQTRKIIER